MICIVLAYGGECIRNNRQVRARVGRGLVPKKCSGISQRGGWKLPGYRRPRRFFGSFEVVAAEVDPPLSYTLFISYGLKRYGCLEDIFIRVVLHYRHPFVCPVEVDTPAVVHG